MTLKHLKAIRTDRRMTQNQLEQSSGVDDCLISMFERGLASKAQQAEALASALSVTVAQLTGDQDYVLGK
jgi:transcriptional regulator with XRE-family HTH domain